MAKQEEIREGIAEQIFIWHIGKPFMWKQDIVWEGPPREAYYEAADMVMKCEDSQGVVIKVERELPDTPYWKQHRRAVEVEVTAELLKAGYVAVEPLIKE